MGRLPANRRVRNGIQFRFSSYYHPPQPPHPPPPHPPPPQPPPPQLPQPLPEPFEKLTARKTKKKLPTIIIMDMNSQLCIPWALPTKWRTAPSPSNNSKPPKLVAHVSAT